MHALLKSLYEHQHDPEFTNLLCIFFGSHQALLVAIVLQLNNGKFVDTILKIFVDKLKNQINDTWRGLRAICDTGMAKSKYVVLNKLNFYYDKTTNLTRPLKLGNIVLPPLFPPKRQVDTLWRQIVDESPFSSVAGIKDATSWNVLSCVRWLYFTKFWYQFIKNPHKIELIIRGDGLPLGEGEACFLLLTLGNFGPLCKCLFFNFVISLALISEKNREDVRTAFAENLTILSRWIQDGFIELAPGLRIPVEVHWGGDESWLRMLLGLKCGKTNWCCIFCYYLRKTAYIAANRIERCLLQFEELLGFGDHVVAPLISGDMDNVHLCSMHGVVPFGKDLLTHIFTYLCTLDVLRKEEITTNIQHWLNLNHVPVDISKLPKYGKWDIKATHTWDLFSNPFQLLQIIGLETTPVLQCMQNMVKHFKTAYKFQFTTIDDYTLAYNFKANVSADIEQWRMVVAAGRNPRNYYHYFAEEIWLKIEMHGSNWKYASDVTESHVHTIKDDFVKYTNRGGFGRSASHQIMKRRKVNSVVYIKTHSDHQVPISPWEKKKLRAMLVAGQYDLSFAP